MESDSSWDLLDASDDDMIHSQSEMSCDQTFYDYDNDEEEEITITPTFAKETSNITSNTIIGTKSMHDSTKVVANESNSPSLLNQRTSFVQAENILTGAAALAHHVDHAATLTSNNIIVIPGNSNKQNEQLVVEFQNNCNTPCASPTNEGQRTTVSPSPSAQAAPTQLQTTTQRIDGIHGFGFQLKFDRNTLLIATLVASAFNLGALTTFMIMQLKGMHTNTNTGTNKIGDSRGSIGSIGSIRSGRSGRSGRRRREFSDRIKKIEDGNGNDEQHISTFVVEKLRQLDPLPFEDYVVDDVREEVMRLLLGRFGRSRL